MTFTPLDDKFHHNPKVLAAGNAAAGLYARLLSWCNDELTDGFVPAAVALSMGTRREIAALVAARRTPAGAGMLEPVEGGWQIHDWFPRNRPAAEIRAQRADRSAVRAEAGRAGGLASGATRRAKAGKPEANAEANREANGEQIEAHHHHLHPGEQVRDHHHLSDRAASGGGGSPDESPRAVSVAVAAMHLLAAADQAGQKITNRRKWLSAVEARLEREHAADLDQLLATLPVDNDGTGCDVIGWRLHRISLGLDPIIGDDSSRLEDSGRAYGAAVAATHLANDTVDRDAFMTEVCDRDPAWATAAVLAYEDATGRPHLHVVPPPADQAESSNP